MAEKFDPDKYLAETEEFDPDKYLSETEEPSKLESALRGAAQGVTFDFADEIAGALSAAGDVATTDSKLSDLKDLYAKYRDIEREKFKKAEEANPATYRTADIAAGIIPALFTGGATAAANVGKVAAKESAKQAAKLGAKYGALGSLGYSQADLTKGEVGKAAKDVAVGTGLGAGLGVVAPAAIKGAGKLGEKAIVAGKDIAEKFPTLSKPFEFAAKHGLTTTKDRSKILQKETENLLDSFKENFQKLGLNKEAAEEEAKALNKTFDMTGDLQKVADEFRNKAKYLPESAKGSAEKMASQIESLYNKQAKLQEELYDELYKEIVSKTDKSRNKQVSAQLKAEGKAVMDAQKTGSSLEQIENIKRKYEQVSELPYETKGGEIRGGKATFKDTKIDPETGEEIFDTYQKQYLQDTTPFQPSDIVMSRRGDELIGSYMNEATGEVFRKYKKIPTQDVDFTQMTVDDTLNWLKATKSKAFEEGGADADMYKEMWKIARNNLPKMIETLPQNKQEFAKLYTILDILGIDDSILKGGGYSHQSIVDLMKKLPNKMGTEKQYLETNLLKEGDKISKNLEDIDLTSEVNKVLEGTVNSSGEFTKAGIAQRTSGLVSEALGAAYGKVSKPIKTIAGKTIPALNKMSDKSLQSVKNKLLASESKGLQTLGEQLQKAIQTEGPLKNALLWSLSQQPALREAVKNSMSESDEDIMSNFEDKIPESEPSEEIIQNTDKIEPSLNQPKQFDINKASELIKKFENNKNVRKEISGFDKQSNRWFPHKSIEGGADTLGYGTKLEKNRFTKEELDKIYKEGISDEEATNEVNKFSQKSYDELSKIAGEDLSNFMNENQISSLLSYWYNTGHIKQPNLINSLKNKDVQGVLKNMDITKVNKIPNQGLIDRRNAEKELFNTPVEEIKNNLNRIMKMKSSGMETPEHEIEQVFQGINDMNISDQEKLALQDEVVQMESFSDAEKIKQLLEKYNKMS